MYLCSRLTPLHYPLQCRYRINPQVSNAVAVVARLSILLRTSSSTRLETALPHSHPTSHPLHHPLLSRCSRTFSAANPAPSFSPILQQKPFPSIAAHSSDHLGAYHRPYSRNTIDGISPDKIAYHLQIPSDGYWW